MICNMSFGAYIILYAKLTIGEDLIKGLCLGTTCIKYRPLTDILKVFHIYDSQTAALFSGRIFSVNKHRK